MKQLYRLITLYMVLCPLFAHAQGQGSWGGATGFPGLILWVLIYSVMGIVAFIYLFAKSRLLFIALSIAAGFILVAIAPGACSGQPAGYQCEEAAKMFAFVIPFLGGSWGACMFFSLVNLFLPARKEDAKQPTS